MSKVKVFIDGIEVMVEDGTTILEAAKSIGINIPTLCYLKEQDIKANCRICTVELKGRNKMVTACSTPVYEGIEVLTNSKNVRELRKTLLELILANHPRECLTCIRNGSCELQNLASEYNIREVSFERCNKVLPIDDCNPSIVREPNKCIKCGRCVEMCNKVQGIGAINFANRSGEYIMTTPFNMPLDSTACLFCGQCTTVCPVGAIHEKEDIERVWEAIYNLDIHVIVQTAPAVRVSLGEEFGLESGSIVTGKLTAALRKLGFNRVFDTNFGADLTIMEEAHELIHRIKNGGVMPMFTSCSPGWVNFVEKHCPDMIPNLSSCKSPQQMFGAIAKSYYAENMKLDSKKIFVVSVMPCTAKKYELSRPEMERENLRDVDASITTRELGRMLKERGVDFNSLEEEEFDSPLGESTGAALLFGATGGVMEAALRTAYETIMGEELKEIDFNEVRGMKNIKEARVNFGDLTLNVAVVNGVNNAKGIVEDIRNNKCKYEFVEVMCCPGGCIGGGGQPVGGMDVKENRAKSLYIGDKNKSIRKSHENPEIKSLYKNYLGAPLSEKAHELLHTHYFKR